MLAGTVLIILTILAVNRGVEVRFTLLAAALALGLLASDPWKIVHKFFATFTDEKFVVPICMAMGFAYVIRHTGCDQHLVRLLVRPLTRVRALLIPGSVVVGFLVNMPVVSQTSTAVTIGPVIIPILLAARISPLTTGAALLLGSSIGGELFNPGAPELRTTIDESRRAAQALGLDFEQYNTARCVDRLAPLNLLGLFTATMLFWWLSLRWERKNAGGKENGLEANVDIAGEPFVVNPIKALVPLIPLVLLYLTSRLVEGFEPLIEVPHGWLEDLPEGAAPTGRFESRLIGAAMLVGSAVAGLVVWRKGLGVAGAFCEGAGYGFTHIISLIVAANCFGEGIKEIGLAEALGGLIQHNPALIFIAACLLPLGFGFLSGSGMAATQSLFGFFAEPALRLGLDPTQVGAVVSLSAAAGRTMSPVSAVNLMCAKMTETTPLELSRRVGPPLLAGLVAIVLVAILFHA